MDLSFPGYRSYLWVTRKMTQSVVLDAASEPVWLLLYTCPSRARETSQFSGLDGLKNVLLKLGHQAVELRALKA
jgi:hypothetical protein